MGIKNNVRIIIKDFSKNVKTFPSISFDTFILNQQNCKTILFLKCTIIHNYTSTDASANKERYLLTCGKMSKTFVQVKLLSFAWTWIS